MSQQDSFDEWQTYFAPLLPWQTQAWSQVVTQVENDHLPHGLLAGGIKGIGKRAFIWRFVAWLLCQDKQPLGACQMCQSCTWLMAGTHPDLMVLPHSSMLDSQAEEMHIKIDDIRRLQEYSHLKGHQVRIMVLDNADTLTLAAANALLKTLEEPRFGVYLILISDYPTRLLPTIKSRVQTLPLSIIDYHTAISYVAKHTHPSLAPVLLAICDGAPLMAAALPDTAWFDKRIIWLKTFVALYTQKRTPILASEYWQGQLPLMEFVQLSRVMMLELMRYWLGLSLVHTDIDSMSYVQQITPPTLKNVEKFLSVLDDVVISTEQNVQEKLSYAVVMAALAQLHSE